MEVGGPHLRLLVEHGDGGLDLLSGAEAVEGDVTGQLRLYDAGTEIDAPPGEGPMMPPGAVQKPVQGPMETNVGTDEAEVIQLVRERFPDFDVPENSEVIRVSITSAAAGAGAGAGGGDTDAGAAPQGGMETGAGGAAAAGGSVAVGLAAAGVAVVAMIFSGLFPVRRRG